MKVSVLIGRILYSFIFLHAVLFHFSQNAIDYATKTGVPASSLMVPFSGVMAFLGGVSIILGYKAKWGALLIILFLIPVTFMMHAYWNETEPMKQQMQMSMFMKNLSLLGAAFIISYFGSGPFSIDKDRAGIKNGKERLKY